MKGMVVEIDPMTANRFLLPKHYSGRRANISKAFGWYRDRSLDYTALVAVCTFGKPASPPLCIGVCGERWADSVYELNRLCRTEDWNEPLSQFVSACLRRLRVENWIVVSYSDTAMHHHGYIYQACNFIYTGCTEERTDKWTEGNKHARHYKDKLQGKYRVLRSAKHRYIYFCTFNKRLKAQWKADLRYPVCPYPKGDNAPDYVLGEYLKPTLVLNEKYDGQKEEETKTDQTSLW